MLHGAAALLIRTRCPFFASFAYACESIKHICSARVMATLVFLLCGWHHFQKEAFMSLQFTQRKITVQKMPTMKGNSMLSTVTKKLHVIDTIEVIFIFLSQSFLTVLVYISVNRPFHFLVISLPKTPYLLTFNIQQNFVAQTVN